jgi:hypothetical protein
MDNCFPTLPIGEVELLDGIGVDHGRHRKRLADLLLRCTPFLAVEFDFLERQAAVRT